MKKLKPCPFCRAKAVICKPLEEITGWVIRCEEWGCCEKSSLRQENKPEHLIKLIENWNERPK